MQRVAARFSTLAVSGERHKEDGKLAYSANIAVAARLGGEIAMRMSSIMRQAQRDDALSRGFPGSAPSGCEADASFHNINRSCLSYLPPLFAPLHTARAV